LILIEPDCFIPISGCIFVRSRNETAKSIKKISLTYRKRKIWNK
jgi:hypothetical protein